jgi:hypothetical protein
MVFLVARIIWPVILSERADEKRRISFIVGL